MTSLPVRWLWAILAAGLVAPQMAAQDVTPDSGSPDMSNVKDVLNGQRHLLRKDDVGVLLAYPSGSDVVTQLVTTDTGNSSFATQKNFNLTSGVPGNTSLHIAAAAGRMYNNGNDVVAIVPSTPNWEFVIWDPATETQAPTGIGNPSRFQPYGQAYSQVVMGDFNGDGLKDALVFYASVQPEGTSHIEWGLSIFTAGNSATVGTLTQGPQLYTYAQAGMPVPISGSFVAGDFDGDGRDEIAVIFTDQQTIQFYKADPKTLEISPWTTNDNTSSLRLPNPFVASGIAAGRFRNTPNDELAVIGCLANSDHQVVVYSISTMNVIGGQLQFQPSIAQTSNSYRPRGTDTTGFIVQAAPVLDWYSNNYEQIVIGLQYHNTPTAYVWIGGFDTDFNFKLAMHTDVEGQGCLMGMQVGNFDHGGSGNGQNPGLQLMLFELEGVGPCQFPTLPIFENLAMKIVDVNVPGGFDPAQADQWPAASNWLKDASKKNNSPAGIMAAALLVGDLQGRSLVLGAPEKAVIPSQIQPDIVLGAPPMHVDYVKPNTNILNPDRNCPNPQSPCVLNLSYSPTGSDGAVDGGFNTRFDFSSTAETTSDRTATTSWSLAVKQGTEVKASFNDGEEGGSLDIKNEMTTTHEGTVSKNYNTYQGQTDTSLAITGITDYVFYTEKDVNVYYYPVLGRTGCPSDNPNCPDSAKVPSYVAFSVPDNVKYAKIDATTLEWYQPIHEPGNILSYPWDLATLQGGFADGKVTPLTSSNPPWMGTDSASVNYSTTWTVTDKQSNSVGSANSFSDDLSMSYTSSVGDADVDGASFTYSLDINASTSLNTMNVTTTSLSASAGIAVNKPLFQGDITECCVYEFAGFVFGPSGQNTPWQDPSQMNINSNGNPVDYKAGGPLFVGFVADPLPSNGGTPAWWQNVYNTPDVALHHPARWKWIKDTKTFEYVASFNAADRSGATSPLDQAFYQMKGFFVSKADDDSTRGPNLAQAKPGTVLTLTARVYNYSLVPANNVQVRFYGQYYCGDDTTPEASCVKSDGGQCAVGTLCGNSFLIGQSPAAPNTISIPGFKGSDKNWTTVSVPFDTGAFAQTRNGNVKLVFWVVAWLQNGTHLLAEMPGHGLSAIPGSTVEQITDIAVESHSNNVGMYGVNSPFFILPASAPGAISGERSAATGGHVGAGGLKGDWQVVLGERARIASRFEAVGGSIGPLTVAYYDGVPGAGGALIDTQRIPYIADGGSYNHRMFFTPKTCGEHSLYAQVFARGQETFTTAPFRTLARMDYLIETQGLVAATQKAKLPEPTREQLLLALRIAESSFREQQHRSAQSALRLYVRLIEGELPLITSKVADPLIGQAKTIAGCVAGSGNR